MGVFKNKKKNIDNSEMSFFSHIDVFRKYFIRSIIAVMLFAIVAYFFKDFIFDTIIFSPKEADFITNKLFCQLSEQIKFVNICINQEKLDVINIYLGGQFKAHILISFIVGLLIAFPFVVAQFWAFIKPALKKNERKSFRGIVFFISLLFSVGVFFGYFLIVPLATNFLSSYTISEEISNQIHFSSYISILATISLSTGLIFELPVIVFFLSKIGLLTPKIMKKYRKHAIVIFFILSAIITPPDVFSQLLISIPLIILWELSIIISRRVSKKLTINN